MCPRINRLFRHLVPVIAILGAVLGFSSPSHAYVQQIVIDQTATVNFTPIIMGTSTAGTPTSYTVYQGRVFGLLSPSNPLNAVITDINLAPTTGGKVSYIANFQIVTPTDPAARNGLVVHSVPNRGGNSITTTNLIQGVTYVQSGWQGDLLSQCSPAAAIAYPCFDLSTGPYGTLNTTTGAFTAPQVSDVKGPKTLAAYVVQVPVATNDGQPPNGTNTITGQVYSHVCTGTNGCGLAVGSTPTSTAQMAIQGPAFPPYHPASTDTSQAQFWTVTSQNQNGVTSAKTPIASSDWAWAYCPAGWPGTPNPNYICLKNGTFNPSLLYEMTYTAANPLVLGVGFAAFRDLESFLRYGTTAPGGGSNPIAGTVSRTYTVGSSQSGAFIHALIFYGFNEDESGRIVFNGAWPQIDGRMMVMNIRWGQPNNLMYLYVGGDEAPVWWADYPNLSRNLPANGMLHRCNESGTCPQILETLGSAELYSEKMSVSICGFTCIADIPLPSNVYRYYTPGATHGGGTVNFNWAAPGTISIPAGQTLPNDPIPETYTNNALQYSFMQLLLNGTPMPPSVYPTLAKGELVLANQAAEGFPNIPGLSFGGNQAWPPFVYDFGPNENYDQQSGVPTVQPPNIQQLLAVYATPVNADGNEDVTGLPTVLGEAPLATYVGWNLATTGWYGPNASNGPGTVGQVFAGAGNSGGYYPFWDTKVHRIVAGDPRLSLQERYGSHIGYECVVSRAVANAFKKRFVLASDATKLLTMASASNVLSTFTPGTADTSLANTLCGSTETHDFNGDGKSDILWRDSSGNVASWLMSGATISSNTLVASVPTTWSIVGQRDFNGDGKADILWRDSSGNVALWLMNGGTVTSNLFVGNVPTTWSIVGTGDFDGDGMADILWRDNTGNVAIWLMNGGTIAANVFIANVPISWSIVGSNGRKIVWRDTGGNTAVWTMNGGAVASNVFVGNVPISWSVAGIGDFDGDGNSDILWRDSLGNAAMWLLDATGHASSSLFVAGVATTWTVAETGDFDGDGKSDILWHDTSGNTAIWFMNSGAVSSSAVVATVATAWSIQGAGAD